MTYAKNEAVKTRGRSAYQAVFGRTPRVPGELLSESSGLVVPPDREDMIIRADAMRLESIKAIAEVNIDQQLKNSILRKTVNTKIPDVSPGARVAYWRDQIRRRSTKKKGGYVIARFIRADPDGHTCWLHSGNRTIQVDWIQVRPCFGFEHWIPSEEDITALKTAEANLRKGRVSEERGPPPPPDEPREPEILDYAGLRKIAH